MYDPNLMVSAPHENEVIGSALAMDHKLTEDLIAQPAAHDMRKAYVRLTPTHVCPHCNRCEHTALNRYRKF